MAKLPAAFKAEESISTFDTIPEGYYEAIITNSEIKNNSESSSDPNGKYLKLTFTITSKKFGGRLIFKNLCIVHNNKKAIDISNSFLKNLAYCCGIESLSNSEQLHDVPVGIKVKIKKNGEYENNEVVSVYKIDNSWRLSHSEQEEKVESAAVENGWGTVEEDEVPF